MIFIASDHAGFELKKELADYVKNTLGLELTDMGPSGFDENDDFPDYAAPLAKKVAENEENRGILICGSGHGMCVAANKIKGIRAILGYDIDSATMGRAHNNANILCLGGRVLSPKQAKKIVEIFLNTDFEDKERLKRRNKKIADLEAL